MYIPYTNTDNYLEKNIIYIPVEQIEITEKKISIQITITTISL